MKDATRQLFTLWRRWSFAGAILVALILGICELCFFRVPSKHGISFWWTVVSPAIIAAGVVLLLCVSNRLERDGISDALSGIGS